MVFCLLGAAPRVAFCTNLEVRAETDKKEVASGEILNFAVTISGSLEESPRVEIGGFDGFGVVATSQSQQIGLQHGRKIQSVVLVYTLVAGDPGERTLGPVKVQYKKEIYETKPVQVKVVAAEPSKPRLQGGVIL